MRIYQRYFKNYVSKKPYDKGRALWEMSLYGVELKIVDSINSRVPFHVFKEINRDDLGISRLKGLSGNILDIGAQVGIVSIYLTKRFPDSHVHSYEAYSRNYDNLLLNLELNDVSNVSARNLAVTGDGRLFEMICNSEENTGGSTGWSERAFEIGSNYSVESITLDEILESLGDVDLLKIDCEGAEHEIITSSKRLKTISHLIGEFHINNRLRRQNYSIHELENLVKESVTGHVGIRRTEMCE